MIKGESNYSASYLKFREHPLSPNRLQARYIIAYVCAKKHDEQSLQQYQTKEINPYFLAKGFAEVGDDERAEVIYKQSSPGIKNDIATLIAKSYIRSGWLEKARQYYHETDINVAEIIHICSETEQSSVSGRIS